MTDDLSKSRDKIERLLSTIDELQASDSSAQLAAKRAERELREEREKALRLEKELEGKDMRIPLKTKDFEYSRNCVWDNISPIVAYPKTYMILLWSD